MERICAIALATVLLGSLACYRPRSVVEDRGPLLASGIVIAAIGDASFAWLSGGSEIAYVADVLELNAAPRLELHAVRVADGVTRQLDPARPTLLTGLTRSLDGSALYIVAQDLSGAVPRYTVREALAHKTLPVEGVSPAPLAVSPDARRVFYRTATGPSVLDASGATFPVQACGAFGVLPIFSPSGDSLLCDASASPVVVDVAGGSTRTLPATDSHSWRAVRWSTSGPQAVALTSKLEGESVHLVDLATGRDRVLHQVDQDALLDFAWAAISNDGSRVAFWETACLAVESIFSCSKTAAWLKVVGVESAKVDLVASGADAPGPIAFSDDGTCVAYTFGNVLHARTLR
jgi:hypothetical protein